MIDGCQEIDSPDLDGLEDDVRVFGPYQRKLLRTLLRDPTPQKAHVPTPLLRPEELPYKRPYPRFNQCAF